MSPHFLIGPAIDEAAAAYELAQGAIIYLTPAARDKVSAWFRSRPGRGHMVKFDVPLKGEGTFNTYTLTPLEQARNVNDADHLARNLLQTFSGNAIDIAVKRQNTVRHLLACYEWRNLRPPIHLTGA